MGWNPSNSSQDASMLPLYNRFLHTRSSDCGGIRDEVIELVARSGLFGIDDLIRLMKVGYLQLTNKQRSEFMRRVLFELKKSERP